MLHSVVFPGERDHIIYLTLKKGGKQMDASPIK
jgi:hypothetical protein